MKKLPNDLVERLWQSDVASSLTNEAAREIERLREALNRQCENMSFVLNHVDIGAPQWEAKFAAEYIADWSLAGVIAGVNDAPAPPKL